MLTVRDARCDGVGCPRLMRCARHLDRRTARPPWTPVVTPRVCFVPHHADTVPGARKRRHLSQAFMAFVPMDGGVEG